MSFRKFYQFFFIFDPELRNIERLQLVQCKHVIRHTNPENFKLLPFLINNYKPNNIFAHLTFNPSYVT